MTLWFLVGIVSDLFSGAEFDEPPHTVFCVASTGFYFPSP